MPAPRKRRTRRDEDAEMIVALQAMYAVALRYVPRGQFYAAQAAAEAVAMGILHGTMGEHPPSAARESRP
ncbi:MAG: hypothetical protein ACEQSH_00420 [Bacteroidia bacterium]